MPIVAPPSMTPAPVSPDRADRPTFVGRSLALDNWRKNYNVPEMGAALANIYNNAIETWNNALQSIAARDIALQVANNPAVTNAAANATAAAAAAQLAQEAAAQAVAVSPDSPIRINTAHVRDSFTLASGYNAVSAGPIEITEGVAATISENATWSIV